MGQRKGTGRRCELLGRANSLGADGLTNGQHSRLQPPRMRRRHGSVKTLGPNGKELVALGTSDNGGVINVVNKTGETVVQMYADEYGNGLVGAYNRKGRGRTLQPGP